VLAIDVGVKVRVDVLDAAFLSERVKPGDLCLDVGANVGVYVLQFARWSAPNGVVVAFEPNPHARKALERHLTLNGLGGRVRVEPAAVADAGGEAILHASGSDGMSRLGAPNVLLGNRTMAIPVPVVTLDEYCAERALVPQWLLLDVEGFELAALRGARRLIASRGAALGIVVEMHPDVWDPEDRRNAALLLAELGRRPVPLTGQRDALSEHGLVFLEPL